jgi:hypothetical protein
MSFKSENWKEILQQVREGIQEQNAVVKTEDDIVSEEIDALLENFDEPVLQEVTDKEVEALKNLSKDMQSVLKGYQSIVKMGDKELKDSKYNKDYEAVLKARDTIFSLIGKVNTQKIMNKEESELDEAKVKEYKGIAYFENRKDAESHMKKFAPKGRIVEYERGYAIQVRTSGPYLNKSGKIDEEVDLDEGKYSAYSDLLLMKARIIDKEGPDSDKLPAVNSQIKIVLKKLGIKEEVTKEIVTESKLTEKNMLGRLAKSMELNEENKTKLFDYFDKGELEQ